MATKVADRPEIKAQRGTKRTCQNADCEARFYDLNRDPITCPVCSTVYELARVAAQAPASASRKATRPEVKKRVYPVEDAPEDAPVAEGEELVAIDGDEDTAPDSDDTLLQDEEESPDVELIIDAPIEEKDEKA